MLRKHGAWTRSSSMILRRKKSTDTTSLMLILLVIFCTFYIYRGSLIPESPIILEQRFSTEISNTLILTEEECSALWPGLSKEVNNAVSQGPFELKRKADDYPGLVQGRIKNGKLYVISANFDNILHHVGATLHALHRAIITSSTKIPDTVFALNIDDVPQVNTWSFSRSDDAFTPTTPWLMPHFSSWSWPKPYIGPFDQALSSIELLEQAIPWESKIDKAVWRGTAWFNPQWSIGLRPKLINVTEDKDWADVEYSGENNMIKIEDFCKYKYILYAEGTSYSGRLPFHQACASIILTPPPTFLMHNTHLMRPIFSSLLPLSGGSDSTQEKTKFPPPDSYPLPETAKAWPFSYPTALANVVFVRPDWSDLEETIKYLERNPEIAKGIAQRQRDLFVQGGYLSEAAEACYWRSLVKGWSEVVRFDENEWEEGMRFETYALLGKTKYA